MTEHEQMILSALRYALGRRSYIMSCTDDYISKMLDDKVSQGFIDNCIRDIEDEYKDRARFDADSASIGWLHDWNPLKEKLIKLKI